MAETRRHPSSQKTHPEKDSWQRRLYIIIFEADTPGGKLFDVLLILFIGISVLNSMLESVDTFSQAFHRTFLGIEWFFTLIFTVEYLVRILVVKKPLGYVFSFFGILDLLAILPSYLGLIITGLPSLIFLRVLRVLRIFRIFKIWKYSLEAQWIFSALRRSLPRIGVFLFSVTTIMVFLGSLMYLVEGPENGFTNVFVSIYWAVVTITTVGYGDISPQTPLGQILASLAMITGYAIIAVPTGIVSAEMVKGGKRAKAVRQICPSCGATETDPTARFCRQCGKAL